MEGRDYCDHRPRNEYLTKPIDKDALIQAVQNLAQIKR